MKAWKDKTVKKKITNKLVRDKIPSILIEQCKAFKAHKLDDEEFENELANKLVEEANEVAEKVHWLNHKCNQEPVSNEELNSDLEWITDLFDTTKRCFGSAQ